VKINTKEEQNVRSGGRSLIQRRLQFGLRVVADLALSTQSRHHLKHPTHVNIRQIKALIQT
jgi:hypothetical protein